VKSGTRTRLFDESDSFFGPAVGLFHRTLADDLAKAIQKAKLDSAVAFCEWWGPNSFAGLHQPGDEMRLTLFDIAIPKRGMVPPKEFLKGFGHLPIPNFLGRINWSRQFVKDVFESKVEGITCEGVVGKANFKRGNPVMAKAKTKVWIDKVHEKYSSEEAARIIDS
jgi:hypothetical protein